MVVGAFPAVKLAVLLFKQISKPIANFAKERAKNNRFFRTYVCMPPAHFYNWCEVQSRMWIMNLGKPVNIPPLNEQAAIELGANLLGEGIIFVLGSAVLILEYNRSSKKEAIKEEERKTEMINLTGTIRELFFTIQKQETEIRELQREVYSLEHRVVVKPWVPKVDGKDSGTPPEPPSSASLGNIEEKLSQLSKVNDVASKPSTPYPDKGIISKSLNYLELSVFNIAQAIEEEVPPKAEPPVQNKTPIYKRRPSLLNEALQYIEHDVKGIM